jgi:glycosyltransferase involved in cell wall biosynthesis
MRLVITNFGPTYPLGIGGGALSNVDLLKVLSRLGFAVLNLGFFENSNKTEYEANFNKAKKLGFVQGTLEKYTSFDGILNINESWGNYLTTIRSLSRDSNNILILRPYKFKLQDKIGNWSGRLILWNNDFDINRAKEVVDILIKQHGKCVTISKYLSDLMENKYGVKSKVLNSVIDWDNLRISPKKKLSLEKKIPMLGLPNPNVFKFGELPYRIIDELSEYKFTIVTSWGWDHDHLTKLKKRKNVVVLRNLVDISHFYKAIDLLLVPTVLPESYPRFIQEAMYLRIPILASAIGNLPELIGESGIVVQSQNAADWRIAVKQATDLSYAKLEEGRKKIIKFQSVAKDSMEYFFKSLS